MLICRKKRQDPKISRQKARKSAPEALPGTDPQAPSTAIPFCHAEPVSFLFYPCFILGLIRPPKPRGTSLRNLPRPPKTRGMSSKATRMAPQDSQDPKMAQDSLKIAKMSPRWPKIARRWPEMLPQHSPRWPENARVGPKMAPTRWPQDSSRWPQDSPRATTSDPLVRWSP
jgi:hypothetical protein